MWTFRTAIRDRKTEDDQRDIALAWQIERIRMSVTTTKDGRSTLQPLHTFLSRKRGKAGRPDLLGSLVAVSDLYGLKLRRTKTNAPSA